MAIGVRLAAGDEAGSHRLVCEHRTRALDAGARRRFWLYWWLMVRYGGAVVLRLLLEAVKRRAEGRR